MITFLNETVLWWHWIILGIVLLIAEITAGTFFMLGLGIAAIITGCIDLLFETSFTESIILKLLLAGILNAFICDVINPAAVPASISLSAMF